LNKENIRPTSSWIDHIVTFCPQIPINLEQTTLDNGLIICSEEWKAPIST